MARAAAPQRIEDLPDVLTPREFMAFTRTCRDVVYAALRRGDIPAVRIGRQWRIPKTGLLRWLGGANGSAQT
jgi:excisionase family DNA binding protein